MGTVAYILLRQYARTEEPELHMVDNDHPLTYDPDGSYGGVITELHPVNGETVDEFDSRVHRAMQEAWSYVNLRIGRWREDDRPAVALSLLAARAKAVAWLEKPRSAQPRGGFLCRVLIDILDKYPDHISTQADILRARHPNAQGWCVEAQGLGAWAPNDALYCLGAALDLDPTSGHSLTGYYTSSVCVESTELAVALATASGGPINSEIGIMFGKGEGDMMSVLPHIPRKAIVREGEEA